MSEVESEKLIVQCKVEFDDAKPHLIGLVNQTFETRTGYKSKGIKLSAFGSGNGNGTEQIERSIRVDLETLYGFVGAD